MTDKQSPVIFSNVRIFYAIAKDSLRVVTLETRKRRRPKNDGSPGHIIKPDLDQVSFKAALTTIVFCSICLEALFHLHISRNFGLAEFKKIDKNTTYEEKLAILGCKNLKLYDSAERLRKVRKFIVHEKALEDPEEIIYAQDEARKAVVFLDSFCTFLRVKLN